MGDETMEHKVIFILMRMPDGAFFLEMRTIFSALPQIYT